MPVEIRAPQVKKQQTYHVRVSWSLSQFVLYTEHDQDERGVLKHTRDRCLTGTENLEDHVNET
jgi:hypothetical protein